MQFIMEAVVICEVGGVLGCRARDPGRQCDGLFSEAHTRDSLGLEHHRAGAFVRSSGLFSAPTRPIKRRTSTRSSHCDTNKTPSKTVADT